MVLFPATNHSNPEVRNLAVEVIVLVSHQVGANQVKNLLHQSEVKKSLLETILSRI